jgi:hypothetical protein
MAVGGDRSRGKLRVILLMGILMMAYSLAEVGISLYVHSLTMFSDGLHNFSDALALAIAYWAEQAKSQAWSSARWKAIREPLVGDARVRLLWDCRRPRWR